MSRRRPRISECESVRDFVRAGVLRPVQPTGLALSVTLGSTGWTLAGRYSVSWAHNDGVSHILLTLKAGANSRVYMLKESDNKFYASMNDGTDTRNVATAALTLAANTVNTFVARATWESTLNMTFNGVALSQADASAVGAQTITSVDFTNMTQATCGPIIASPSDKGATWTAGISTVGFAHVAQLVRDFMVAGDYILPLGHSTTAYVRVR